MLLKFAAEFRRRFIWSRSRTITNITTQFVINISNNVSEQCVHALANPYYKRSPQRTCKHATGCGRIHALMQRLLHAETCSMPLVGEPHVSEDLTPSPRPTTQGCAHLLTAPRPRYYIYFSSLGRVANHQHPACKCSILSSRGLADLYF